MKRELEKWLKKFMPELPEVETIARQLDRAVSGKIVDRVEVIKSRCFLGNEKLLEGRRMERVDRHAKVVVFHFKGFKDVMMVHLKMTGQLIFRGDGKNIAGGHPTADWVQDLPSSDTRVIIAFTDGTKMFFNDQRMFGWMKLVTEDELRDLEKKRPPDVTDGAFTVVYFKKLLGKTSRAVKLVLMDQEKMGGVGNIYANDALWLSEIDPRRKAKELGEGEMERLYWAVKKVIEEGIKYGGASADNYVQTSGMGGTYQEHFLVYNKDGQMCSRDGGVIKKMWLGGRGTYCCAKCQK